MGILIPLEEEYTYIRDICDVTRTVSRGADFYYEMVAPSGQRMICTVLEDMGVASAAIAAERMISEFDVPLLVVVGIAGALDKDLRLGDVVVANEVDHYTLNLKAVGDDHGFTYQHAGRVFQADYELINRVRAFARMPESADSLERWKASCMKRNPIDSMANAHADLTRPAPSWQAGAVASGDVLGAASSFAQWIKVRNRKLVALEMESAGVATSMHTQIGNVKFLVVRGISDFADERKEALDAARSVDAASSDKGAWRRYAAQNAMTFLLSLLDAGVLAKSADARPK